MSISTCAATNFGETLTLLKLEGVIPTEYQGVTYQTPVSIWVPKQYPQEAPIAYVTPTRGPLQRAWFARTITMPRCLLRNDG